MKHKIIQLTECTATVKHNELPWQPVAVLSSGSALYPFDAHLFKKDGKKKETRLCSRVWVEGIARAVTRRCCLSLRSHYCCSELCPEEFWMSFFQPHSHFPPLAANKICQRAVRVVWALACVYLRRVNLFNFTLKNWASTLLTVTNSGFSSISVCAVEL